MKKSYAFLNSSLWTAIMGVCLLTFFWIGNTLISTRTPQEGKPAELYSNQTLDDLQLTFSQAIKEAESSVQLIIYTLTDKKILHALRTQSEEGIDVQIICDAEASRSVVKKLGPKVKTVLRKAKGLMHQKILVVDGKKVWIGSANMTPTSLRAHHNLVLGLQNSDLAKNILEKKQTMTDKGAIHPVTTCNFDIGGQDVEMWFLPDNPDGDKRIKQLIQTAKKTIKVAMFTWTRLDLVNEIIHAKNRGVATQVALDAHSGAGVSAKVAAALHSGGVPIRFSKGEAILHHKFMIIDDRVLVVGSANWTHAAFTKNDDCFVVLQDLTVPQKRFLKNLWRVIVADSEPYEI
ncbi:MAG: Phospholipase D [Chlamydiae bacterium]|nr:Phospholipase D [Chlamydiota bacterium]